MKVIERKATAPIRRPSSQRNRLAGTRPDWSPICPGRETQASMRWAASSEVDRCPDRYCQTDRSGDAGRRRSESRVKNPPATPSHPAARQHPNTAEFDRRQHFRPGLREKVTTATVAARTATHAGLRLIRIGFDRGQSRRSGLCCEPATFRLRALRQSRCHSLAADGYEFVGRHGAVLGEAGRSSADWLTPVGSVPGASRKHRAICSVRFSDCASACITLPRRVYRFGSGAWAPASRLSRNVSGTRVVERA